MVNILQMKLHYKNNKAIVQKTNNEKENNILYVGHKYITKNIKNNTFLYKNITLLQKDLLDHVHKLKIGGYVKKFIIYGMGYRIASYKNNKLDMKLGYSHSILLKIPKDIRIIIHNDKEFSLTSMNKDKLNAFCNTLQQYRRDINYIKKGIFSIDN